MAWRFAVSLSLFFSLSALAEAPEAPQEPQPALPTAAEISEEASEFRRLVDGLNERYEDFFVRETEQRRYLDELKQGLGEVKALRQAERDGQLEALRLYKLEPKEKPDTTALEAEHEAAGRAMVADMDRHRHDYVAQRQQLRRISESARKIPENRDAGLE